MMSFVTNVSNNIHQWLANFFCKKPKGKYSQLCQSCQLPVNPIYVTTAQLCCCGTKVAIKNE